jgi:hypothetical protein
MQTRYVIFMAQEVMNSCGTFRENIMLQSDVTEVVED